METLPLHPKLVHLPIALAVLMPLLSSSLLFAWWRGWLPKRTWVVAFAAQALLLASGWFAMRTGESDEERVEHLVPERAIEAHEEAAEILVWGSGVVLALALVPLLLRDSRTARLAGLGTVAGTAVVLILAVGVGESGGDLVYRHGAATAFITDPPAHPAARGSQPGRAEDDDR